MISAICNAMAVPDRVEGVLGTIDCGSGLIFSLLERETDPVRVQELRERLPSSEPILRKRLRALSYRGLVADTYLGYDWAVFVPREILRARIAARHEPSFLQQHYQTALFESQPPNALARDLLTLLDFVLWNDIELVKGGQFLPRWAMQQLQPLMLNQDVTCAQQRLDFICHCSRQLGLTEVRQGYFTCSSAVEAWAAKPFEEQLESLTQLWTADSEWHEPVLPDEPFPWVEIDPTSVRRALLSWLAACQPQTPYSIESLRQIARERIPQFLISLKGTLYHKHYRSEQDVTEGRPGFETRVVIAIVKSSLYWMGAVELGRSENGELTAFRLTPIGSDFARGMGLTPSGPYAQAEISEDLEVRVSDTTSPAFWKLLKFTTSSKDHGPAYRLITEESIHRGLEHGLFIPELLGLLAEGRSHHSIAPAIAAIARWGETFKRIEIQRIVLLEADDQEVLDEVLTKSVLSGTNPRRISPLAAALLLPVQGDCKDESVRRLGRELRRAGYSAIVK